MTTYMVQLWDSLLKRRSAILIPKGFLINEGAMALGLRKKGILKLKLSTKTPFRMMVSFFINHSFYSKYTKQNTSLLEAIKHVPIYRF